MWAFEKTVSERLVAEDRVSWGTKGTNFPRLKLFKSEVQGGVVPSTWWDRTRAGDNQEARRELRKIFSGLEDSFDTPKPSRLVKRMLEIASEAEEGAIVMDFFAGSCTTAHAVLERNDEDGGDRKFVMVQLPEPTDNEEYPTIAAMGRERIRRVMKRLDEEGASKLKTEDGEPQNRGFRAFKLTSSNFEAWDGAAAEDGSALADRLLNAVENVKSDRSREDMLYEVLLRAGWPLTTEVETLGVADREVFSAKSEENGTMFVCLEDPITEELLREMMGRKPAQVVCLDTAFHGNDQLKTNTVLEMRDRGIEFRTI